MVRCFADARSKPDVEAALSACAVASLGPGWRAEGPASTNGTAGRLAPAVIQGIVRSNFSAFRACYEKGLGRSSQLHGKVTVRFAIDASGRVAYARDEGSNLPDPEVVSCVVSGYSALRFPAPEGGVVTVVYPIDFAPEP